jgi:hypothetical protein
MTVTRPPKPHNGRPQTVAQSVIRGVHAARGLLLAAATFMTALSGLIVALAHR